MTYRWSALLLCGALWGCRESSPRTANAPVGPRVTEDARGQSEESPHQGERVADAEVVQAPAEGNETSRCDALHEVTQEQLHPLFHDIEQVSRTLRIHFVREGGVATGMGLRGIRKNSLVMAMGFQNADEVRAVNGYPLTSPDEATAAHTALRDAKKFRFELLRGGRPWSSCVVVVAQQTPPPPP